MIVNNQRQRYRPMNTGHKHVAFVDLDILLECMRVQTSNDKLLFQGLVNLAEHLTTDAIKSYFCQCGGLTSIYDLLISAKTTEIKVAALYCLSSAVEKNEECQTALTNSGVFQYVRKYLLNEQDSKLVYGACYFCVCLVSQNYLAQELMRTVNCLDDLMNIFRRSTAADENVNLLGILSTCMCMCLLDPPNEENQLHCGSLLPCLLSQPISPAAIRTLRHLVAGCRCNQDRLRKCGGIDILTSSLNQQIKGNVVAAADVVAVLDACLTDHEVNSLYFINCCGLQPLFVLLGDQTGGEEEQLKVVLTLSHILQSSTVSLSTAQYKRLVYMLTVATDDQLVRMLKYVLHLLRDSENRLSCLQEFNKKKPEEDCIQRINFQRQPTVCFRTMQTMGQVCRTECNVGYIFNGKDSIKQGIKEASSHELKLSEPDIFEPKYMGEEISEPQSIHHGKSHESIVKNTEDISKSLKIVHEIRDPQNIGKQLCEHRNMKKVDSKQQGQSMLEQEIDKLRRTEICKDNFIGRVTTGQQSHKQQNTGLEIPEMHNTWQEILQSQTTGQGNHKKHEICRPRSIEHESIELKITEQEVNNEQTTGQEFYSPQKSTEDIIEAQTLELCQPSDSVSADVQRCNVFKQPIVPVRRRITFQPSPVGSVFDQLLLGSAEPSAGRVEVLEEKQCSGCCPQSVGFLDSRSYNLALETGAYTCSKHRHIRAMERSYILRSSKHSHGTRLLPALGHTATPEAPVHRGIGVYDFRLSSCKSKIKQKLSPPAKSPSVCTDQYVSRGRERMQRKERTAYSRAEEASLMDGVSRMGARWNQILWSHHFHPTRTAVDLMEKHKRMTTEIKAKTRKHNAPFSMCEDRRLRRGVRALGHNWAGILAMYTFCEGRCHQDLRNRWRQLQKDMKRQ